jgi:hypothetical protein
MKGISAYLVRVCLLFFPAFPLSAQKLGPFDQKGITQALRTVGEQLMSKSEQFRAVSADAPGLIEQIGHNIRVLDDVSREKQMPDVYLVTLDVDRRLLVRVNSVEKVTMTEVIVVQDVAGDTNAKRENAEKNPQNPYEVKAIATPKDARNKPVEKLYIYYVQKGLENEPSDMHFPKESAPTTENIMASGNWVMWTQVPNKPQVTGRRQRIELKDQTGAGEYSFDLPAP